MATITSGNHSYVLNEATTAVAINSFARLPGKYGLLFNIVPSMKPSEQHASVGGLGKFQPKSSTAAATRGNTTQQFEKSWTHGEYALAIDFERKYVDDEAFGHFAKMGYELGDSALRTYEHYCSTVFTDAFAGATVTAEDGLSLCNDAHVNVDGGNSQDNSGTNSLTYSGWKTTKTAHRKLTNYDGEKVLINPNMLLVPVDLEEDALQVAQATGKPGSSNNDYNVFAGTVDVVVWEYLQDTNAWFSIDAELMQRNLFLFIRMALEFYGNRDWDTHVSSVGGYTRFSFGPEDWRWVYGNNPS